MYILKLDGMEIEVSEEVYKEFYRYQRKERYFSEDLKSGRIHKDRVSGKEVYLPPREVSLEGILEQGGFWQNDADVEEQVEQAVLRENLMRALETLADKELFLIHALYYEGVSVSELARRQGVSRKKIRKHRDRILAKLRKWF